MKEQFFTLNIQGREYRIQYVDSKRDTRGLNAMETPMFDSIYILKSGDAIMHGIFFVSKNEAEKYLEKNKERWDRLKVTIEILHLGDLE